MLFVYAQARCSFSELASTAAPVLGELQRAIASGRIRPAGAPLFIYHDPSEDPDKTFDMEIGVPVREAGAPPAGFAVRQLPAFHCATLLYRGPMRLLNKAYEKLLPEMINAGLVPSVEMREEYLVWESPQSAGNVVQIEAGIR